MAIWMQLKTLDCVILLYYKKKKVNVLILWWLKKTEWLTGLIHFKNNLFWKKILFTLKKNIYFAIYKHHYSSIETWWSRWIEQKTVNEVDILRSSACKICTEGITDVPKHNNSCYDHIFMIRSKISPQTSLLSADSTAAWALHECGAE